MVTTIQCMFCVHLITANPQRCCAAFPEEIPTAIWEGKYDHRRPHPDDHGIQLQLREGVTEASLKFLDRSAHSPQI